MNALFVRTRMCADIERGEGNRLQAKINTIPLINQEASKEHYQP